MLDVWNAVKRGGFDMKVRVTEEAVSRVMTVKEFLKLKENVAYPGKSSLLKKHSMRFAKTCGSPPHRQSKAGGSSSVQDKNCILHGVCRAAPPAGGSAPHGESAGIVFTSTAKRLYVGSYMMPKQFLFLAGGSCRNAGLNFCNGLIEVRSSYHHSLMLTSSQSRRDRFSFFS